MQHSEIRDTVATHQTPRIAFHFIRFTKKITAFLAEFGMELLQPEFYGIEV
jgi:hypothetical protein